MEETTVFKSVYYTGYLCTYINVLMSKSQIFIAYIRSDSTHILTGFRDLEVKCINKEPLSANLFYILWVCGL